MREQTKTKVSRPPTVAPVGFSCSEAAGMRAANPVLIQGEDPELVKEVTFPCRTTYSCRPGAREVVLVLSILAKRQHDEMLVSQRF